MKRKSVRSELLPNRFFKVGRECVIEGERYKAVEVDVMELPVGGRCKLCDLNRSYACNKIQCSKTDRADRKSVYFKKIEEL